MPWRCVEIAGRDKDSITLEVINEAVQSLSEIFERLCQHAVKGVRLAASRLEQLN